LKAAFAKAKRKVILRGRGTQSEARKRIMKETESRAHALTLSFRIRKTKLSMGCLRAETRQEAVEENRLVTTVD